MHSTAPSRHSERGNRRHRCLQEPESLDDRRRSRRHHRSQDPRSARAARRAQPRRQLSRVLCAAPGDWTPNGTLVGSYKFSDALAFTASFSYDDEKTLDQQFQDQNRNQWLITDSATGPYVGALTPAGLGVTPGGSIVAPAVKNAPVVPPRRPAVSAASTISIRSWPISPMTTTNARPYGASFGVSAKVTDAITTSLNYFFSREQETSLSYTDKVWFNGQGTSPGFLLPAIDPADPTRSMAMESFRAACSIPTAPRPRLSTSRIRTRAQHSVACELQRRRTAARRRGFFVR